MQHHRFNESSSWLSSRRLDRNVDSKVMDPLRLGYVNEALPLFFRSQPADTYLHGIFVDAWNDFARLGGFGRPLIRRHNDYGNLYPKRSGWDGILRCIHDGTIDGALEKFEYSSARILDFHTTVPIMYSMDEFFDSRLPHWDKNMTLVLVYSTTSIFALIISLFAVLLLEKTLYVIREELFSRREENECLRAAQFFRCLMRNPSYETMFLPLKCRRHVLVFYLAAAMAVLIMYQSTFRCNSNIVTFQATPYKNFIADLRSGAKALVVVDASVLTWQQVFELFGVDVRGDPTRIIVEPRYDEMAKLVCSDVRYVAFAPEYNLAIYSAGTGRSRLQVADCNFLAIDVSKAPMRSAIANSMRSPAPYTFLMSKRRFTARDVKLMNQVILTLFQTDTINNFFWKKYTGRPFRSMSASIEVGKSALPIRKLNFIFKSYFFGILLSLIAFLLEIYFKLTRNLQSFCERINAFSRRFIIRLRALSRL